MDIRSDDDLKLLRDISRRPGRPSLLVRARDPGRLDGALETADAALAPADAAEIAARQARARGKPLVLEGSTVEELIEAARAAARTTDEIVLSLSSPGKLSDLLGSWRRLAADPWLNERQFPFLLQSPPLDDADENLLRSSVLLGSLLSDGLGDAAASGRGADPAADIGLTYDILQGAGARAVKTEFISCPSCGRTLFDLQAATGLIRKAMGHLAGVKIAIMGCIVNGPGEMADADFGYVGAGPGRINLYAGRECVEKGVPEEEAVRKLAALIRAKGKWVEPAGF
jgi:4-hydroxy-3-methylbut-2-en-1-yl diphosphate synthase IspG/GcpE